MEINKLTFYNIRYNIKIEGVYNRGLFPASVLRSAGSRCRSWYPDRS